jgi:hypothetical protein
MTVEVTKSTVVDSSIILVDVLAGSAVVAGAASD